GMPPFGRVMRDLLPEKSKGTTIQPLALQQTLAPVAWLAVEEAVFRLVPRHSTRSHFPGAQLMHQYADEQGQTARRYDQGPALHPPSPSCPRRESTLARSLDRCAGATTMPSVVMRRRSADWPKKTGRY